MRPGVIEGANCRLGPPPGASEEECLTLLVRRDAAENGWPVQMSAWFPSPEELRRLNEGAPVYLHVFGTGHPPVWLGVGE